jgi:hypothetical protein
VTSNATYLNSAVQSGAFLTNVFGIAQRGNGIAAINASSEASCTEDLFPDISHQVSSAGLFLEGLAYLPADAKLGAYSVKDL